MISGGIVAVEMTCVGICMCYCLFVREILFKIVAGNFLLMSVLEKSL